jgi:hypothetical protein
MLLKEKDPETSAPYLTSHVFSTFVGLDLNLRPLGHEPN